MIKVITGDCPEIMADLDPGSVNLVFADPPYNQRVDYGAHYNDRMTPAGYRAFSRDWISAAARLLAPDGSMFVLNSWKWFSTMERCLKRARLHVYQIIVWEESFGVNCPRKYNMTTRPLIWAVRDPKRFTFNREAVNMPSDRQAKYNDKRANPAGKNWGAVWRIKRLAGTHKERIPGFPTQLPIALLEPIVGAHSNPRDLVLDPFSGSGTTGAVCVKLRRRYIGIELSEEFTEMSRARLAGVTPSLPRMV
jgi:site-specific DNA-methyltransferase (adenine-specific)